MIVNICQISGVTDEFRDLKPNHNVFGEIDYSNLVKNMPGVNCINYS